MPPSPALDVSSKMEKVGLRITLSEDEGRKLFQEQLPLSGTVERVYKGELTNPWCLLSLDNGFDYQIQDEESKEFRGFVVSKLLIRSRWQGYSIGSREPTSVFVLIAEDESLFEEESIDPKSFHFESWAMCKNN